MSQALTLARPYARAAFLIAKDAGALAEWSAALDFAARIAADPQASQVLGHPALTREQAVALLAPEAAPASFNDFLSLLDNRRIGLLPEIAGLYAGRADAEQVVSQVTWPRCPSRAGLDHTCCASAWPRGRLETYRRGPDRRRGHRRRRRGHRRLAARQAGEAAGGVGAMKREP